MRYMTTSEFMPYHAVVAGVQWQQVPSGLQTIILGMLRILAGGFAACGLGVAFLSIVAYRGQAWAGYASAMVGLAVWVPTIAVTYMLRAAQPSAQPPTAQSLVVLGLVLAGAVLAVLSARSGASAA